MTLSAGQRGRNCSSSQYSVGSGHTRVHIAIRTFRTNDFCNLFPIGYARRTAGKGRTLVMARYRRRPCLKVQ